MLILSIAACSAPATWPVSEALDVPPPPGFVSLDLGPTKTSTTFELGAAVALEGAERSVSAEILDVRELPAGRVLTVYAEAAGAGPWVESASPVTVRVVPR